MLYANIQYLHFKYTSNKEIYIIWKKFFIDFQQSKNLTALTQTWIKPFAYLTMTFTCRTRKAEYILIFMFFNFDEDMQMQRLTTSYVVMY
jgi:hypothetical protein